MEIKTCEEYVLAQLDYTQKSNVELVARLNLLAKEIGELLKFINPQMDIEESKVKFDKVDAVEYLKKIEKINRIILNKPLEDEEQDKPVALEEDKEEEQE